MEPLADDLIYSIYYLIKQTDPPTDLLGVMQEVPDKRTIYTRHAPPVAHAKLEEMFHPLKVEILHWAKFRYLP